MSYKNTIKLLSSNFVLVWKQLAFCLISLAICVGLSLAFAKPVFNLLSVEGWVDELTHIFEVVYTSPNELNMVIKDLLIHFKDIIFANFGEYVFSIIGLVIVAFILPIFLVGLAEFTQCELINSQMSSFVSLGFSTTLINNFKKATIFSLIRMAISIVAYVLIFGLLLLYLTFAKGILSTVFLLTALVLCIVVISSLKLTILSNLAPKLVDEEKRIKRVVKKTFKLENGQFLRTFSNSIILILTIICVNFIFGIFTVFVGLIVTIPASMVAMSIFMMTNYYTLNGKEYYLTENLIVEPKQTKKIK